ncbi:MAG: SdrD B-like domain-containing protein [Candidatus Methanoperedens sp.]|nr:SdrD B-like domain-containing protein [Candidatus Methanoperedens sp.]
MNKLLSIFIVLVIFGSAASAAEINGNVVSFGKKLADQKVTLSGVNATQNADTGVVYNFKPLSDTTTDKDGNYAFKDLNDGMYRVNVTYNDITYGENIGLRGKAIVDFNLSEKIEGYVLKVNNTLEGVAVRLMDETGIEVMSIVTNKTGKYSFNKVNAGKSYMVQANYADVPYTKQVNASEKANFTVYESTKNGDVLSVSIDHIVLSKATNGIKVDEYVEFVNTGDKAFFSKDRAYVGISTPEGITRFQTDAMECCLQREKDAAWIDPMNPILPGGTYTAQISYVFNPESSKNLFYKGMIYNTSYITLLSDKKNGFGIESKYAKKEIVQNEGKEFEVLSFMKVPKDQKLDIQITGYVPSNTGTGGDFGYLIPVVAVVLIGAVVYPLLKNKIGKKRGRRFVKTVPAADVSIDEPQEADGIIQQPDVVSENTAGKDIGEMSFEELLACKNAAFESILALENKFNAGEITEKEYKELKKECKENATLVLKQLKEASLNLDLNQPVLELEKMIAHIGDIDILEELLEREKEGDNRNELMEIIEQRIDDIERNE